MFGGGFYRGGHYGGGYWGTVGAPVGGGGSGGGAGSLYDLFVEGREKRMKRMRSALLLMVAAADHENRN